MDSLEQFIQEPFWTLLGVIGGVFFFGRFYIQWFISERRKESVVPISFWYMSCAGSIMLYLYAYHRESPGGTFGVAFNTVIYCRNLIYIWKERGLLTRTLNIAAHLFAGAIAAVAIVLTAITWRRGYHNNVDFWAWSAIWAIGQGVFFLRFLIQWIMTEYEGKSIVPPIFWHLSLLGVCLHGAYFYHRAEWLFTIGTVADALPYVRNLWLIRNARRRRMMTDKNSANAAGRGGK